MSLRWKMTLAILVLLLAAGCGGAYAPEDYGPEATEAPMAEPLLFEPVDTATLAPTEGLPTVTLPPGEPPLPTQAPSDTPLPTDTSTPEPTATRPAPQGGGAAPGIWTGEPTYVESQPGMLFQLTYDDTLWEFRADTEMGIPGLVHLLLPGCTILPTAGRGLSPDWSVSHSFRLIGERSFEVVLVSRNGLPQFASYYGGDGIVFTGFQVSFGEQMDACLQDAELVFLSLASTPAPTPTEPPATP